VSGTTERGSGGTGLEHALLPLLQDVVRDALTIRIVIISTIFQMEDVILQEKMPL